MNLEGSERRRATRVDIRIIVTCKVKHSIEMHMQVKSREIQAMMLNLSETGMAILTPYEMPESTLVTIDFILAIPSEENKMIEVLGNVRHCTLEGKKYRIGISFIEMSREDKEAVAGFIRTCEK